MFFNDKFVYLVVIDGLVGGVLFVHLCWEDKSREERVGSVRLWANRSGRFWQSYPH